MTRIENDCVKCGFPCMGDSCKYRNVEHYYCDRCEYEADDLYEHDGDELCLDCLLEVTKIRR